MGKTLRIFKLITPVVLILWTLSAHSSPFPALGSSALVAPEKGLFYISKGFNLSNPDSLVKVKTDTLKNNLSLEDYAKKWMKDYSQYGFDLLGSRSFKENEARGIVVDLYHKKTQTQMRQTIFLKEKNVVILTCINEKSEFAKILAQCNQTIKSFSWTK